MKKIACFCCGWSYEVDGWPDEKIQEKLHQPCDNCFSNEMYIEEEEKIMSSLKNYTPHDIHIMNKDYAIIKTIKSQGNARAVEKKEIIGELAGVPIYQTKFEDVEGLPEPEEGITYIVSRIILEACPDRKDLVTTSSIVREDENGNLSNHPFAKGKIVGCQAFSI